MKAITKTFSTMKEAERFQNRLYNKYDEVRLVSFPRFSEHGQYVWRVK